jgi:hypothetical protein
MLREYFQEGGPVDEAVEYPFDEGVEDTADLSSGSPTQMYLMSQMLGPSTEMRRIEREMKSSADQVRAALRAARERIAAQQYDPSAMWFDIARGFGAPTRTGAFGETMGNVGKALSEHAQKRGEFEREQAGQLSDLDLLLARAGDPLLEAQFEIEKIRAAQLARLIPGLVGANIPADLQMWNELTRNLSPELKERARKIRLGIMSRAGQFTVRTINGVPTLVGIDSEGNDIEESQIPLTTLGQQAGAGQALKTAETTGTGLGKQYTDLTEGALVAQNQINRLSQIEEMLRDLDTGVLTPLGMKASGLLASFGIDVDENLDAKQAAVAITRSLALQMRNPAGGAGMPGQLSNADRDYLDTMVPRLTQTPEGRTLLIQSMKQMAQRQIDTAKLARDYKKRVGQFDEYFFDELQRFSDENPIFTSGLLRPRNVSPEQWYALSARQQAELLDRLKQPRARGGRVRYQTGGRVITLSDGTTIEVGPAGEESSQQRASEQASSTPSLDSLNDDLLRMGLSAVAGAGAGMLGNELLPNRRGLTPGEFQVSRAFAREEIDPVAAMAELERLQRMGTPATLMTEPSMRGLAEESLRSARPAEARAAIEHLERQGEAAHGRLESQVRAGLRPQGSYFATLEDLTNALYSNSKPLYEAAYAKYPGIVESAELHEILESDYGREAVANAAKLMRIDRVPIGRADVTGMVRKPSLQFLDYVKRGLDQIIDKEESQGPTTLGHALRGLRRRFRDALDAAAPGEYKAARQQYAGDLEVRDALEQGRIFNKFQPEELATRAQGMSQAERSAFRTGMAQRLMEIIENPSTDSNTARKLISSPKMVASLQPFFDSPAAFDVFRNALQKEVELYSNARELTRAGERGQIERQKGALRSTVRAVGEEALGFTITQPLNWANRVLNSVPVLSQKQADEILRILQTNDPNAMAALSRRFSRARARTPTGRRAAAAAIGAAVGAGASALAGRRTEKE